MNVERRTQPIERYIWLLIITVLIIVLILSFINFRKRIQTLQTGKNSMTKEISVLQDSLESVLYNWGHYPRLDYPQLDFLKNLGLKDPVNDIIADLNKHPELIPFKGVLGGTMRFAGKEGVHILNIHYVLATFDDGHIEGSMLLQYDVAPGGKISWKALNARLE